MFWLIPESQPTRCSFLGLVARAAIGLHQISGTLATTFPLRDQSMFHSLVPWHCWKFLRIHWPPFWGCDLPSCWLAPHLGSADRALSSEKVVYVVMYRLTTLLWATGTTWVRNGWCVSSQVGWVYTMPTSLALSGNCSHHLLLLATDLPILYVFWAFSYSGLVWAKLPYDWFFFNLTFTSAVLEDCKLKSQPEYSDKSLSQGSMFSCE